MTDPIRTLVEKFVEDLRAAIKEETVNEILAQLGAVGRDMKRRPGRPPKAGNGAAPQTGRAARIDVAEMSEKVFRFVADNQDQGVSRGQILSTFGLTTSQYSYIMDKLHSEKRIESKGEKRAARWYPAGAAKPQTSLPIADAAKGKRGRKPAGKKAA